MKPDDGAWLLIGIAAIGFVIKGLLGMKNSRRADELLSQLIRAKVNQDCFQRLTRIQLQYAAKKIEQLESYVDFLKLQILDLEKKGLFKDHTGKFRKKVAG